MPGNITPIFSRVGDIQGSVNMTVPVAAASSGYWGTDANTYTIYTSDVTNGGFLQRVRLKANGSNPANVVRFYLCNTFGSLATTTSAPQTPTATVAATTGTLTPGTYFGKIQAIDAFGQPGVFSTEASATVPATGNNIVWGWAAPATVTQGVSGYRVIVGLAAGQEQAYFANISGTSTSYTQTNTYIIGTVGTITGGFIGPQININSLTLNSTLLGEISIPATTATATAGTVDIDYLLNIAIPPGYRVLAGLGTATANGIIATAIAGKY